MWERKEKILMNAVLIWILLTPHRIMNLQTQEVCFEGKKHPVGESNSEA